MSHPLLSFFLSARGRTARGLLALAGLVGASPASAQTFSIGLGAGVDRGRVDCVDSFPCDRSSSHWKRTGGYRVSEAVELQATFFGSGQFKGGDTTPLGTEFGGSFKVRGFGVTAGYRYGLAPGWSVAARAGAAAVRTRFEYENDAYGSASKTRLEPLAGIGVAYAVTPSLSVGVDYDVTRFKVHTQQGLLQMLGLAARYSF